LGCVFFIMAGLERWNAKWDSLAESDEEVVLGPGEAELLKHFPPDLTRSIVREPGQGKRVALVSLNCYLMELQGPRSRRTQLHRVLLGVCDAVRGLEEGGEVETLLLNILQALSHPSVCPENVQLSLEAAALLKRELRDSRVVQVIVQGTMKRLEEFSTAGLARVCWSAATMNDVDLASVLLEEAILLVVKRAKHFTSHDSAVLAWACAVGCPARSGDVLQALFDHAELPVLDSPDALIMAWAVAACGTISGEETAILHDRLRTPSLRHDAVLLHGNSFNPQQLDRRVMKPT